ncbi:MAG: hypothetical protein FJ194_06240 [Gammaproteobacteria bacterium]|nr:hypothetical protein [Gammaproteobacteria bacterium]
MIARRLRMMLALGLLTLAGCSAPKVAVQGTFPVPLVNPYPIHVGWHLDSALTSYVHKEKIDRGGEWVISVGAVQQSMFDSLSKGMFKGYTFLDSWESSAPVQLIFVPSIEQLQFSTPKQTRSKYFEVWIKYKFELRNPDGTSRGEFPLTAYGKAHIQNYSMNTNSAALQEAANAACRDAMAFFALQFRTLGPVKAWLDQNGLGS